MPHHSLFKASLLGLGIALASATALAQDAVETTASFRTLALGKTLSNVFYDIDGKPKTIMAGSSGFSSPYQTEIGEKVEIYREIPGEKPTDPPQKLSIADFTLPDAGPYLVLFHVNPLDTNNVLIKVVNDSWELHPVGFMRVFNYSPRLAMIKIGDEVAELRTSDSHQFPYSDKLQVWLQAAVLEKEEWALRVSAPQALIPNSRSTIVLVDQEPSEDRPVTEELLVRNFIERAPKPKE
ncbi:hypothetical protein [Cerasicoccus maritimus]|uniref:hypothetical protein n=1 Tax=Cerasicoccus maritimus TaxID=490089 RepID=UPI002852C9DB|nr:hypothetical protein [Cerasicoccus maritimus]